MGGSAMPLQFDEETDGAHGPAPTSEHKPIDEAALSHARLARLCPSVPERYVMIFLCALCTCINYADRVNMSVAIIYMAETYSFTLQQQSMVMSAFFLGYLPMQMGGALLCRRFGGKSVLSYGALMWSLFTILTPAAADLGFGPLLLCRVFMGLAEGVAFPGVYHFLSAWIPSHERTRSTALFLTGANVGTTLALIVSPIIIDALHWRFVFYSFGSVGFAWIAAWQLIAYDRDDTSGRLSNDGDCCERQLVDINEEANDLAESAPDASNTVAIPLTSQGIGAGGGSNATGATRASMWKLTPEECRIVRIIVTDRRTLSVCGAQGIFALIHYVILSWLPTYFRNVFHTDTKSLSFTFVPYAAMAVAANIGGWCADSLLRQGHSLTRVRKGATVVASVGAGITVVAFAAMSSVPWALAMASLSMAFMSIQGFECAYYDLASPGATGMFKAVSNTLASFAGFVAVPLSTLVLTWVGGSWRIMFGTLAFWHAVLGVVFCTGYSGERVLTENGR